MEIHMTKIQYGRIGVAVALLLATISSPSTAQSPNIHQGERMRVTTATVKNATGVLQSYNSDSLVLLSEPLGARLAVPSRSIGRIDVSQGRLASEGAKRGAIWGAIIGASDVVLTFALSNRNTPGNTGQTSRGAGAAGLFVGSIGIGAAIGAVVKAEKWEKAEMLR
jgi:hypothetical protein